MSETVQCARNAHAAWRRLAAEDPEHAYELANPLLAVLESTANTDRAKDVVHWIESGAVRHRPA